ncbi:lipocalin family protein [Flavobacterium sp.]|jgi:hypothetical protein|uniref:lipocalin family protein n=1 Tax=Flavobacterium sp. TaxID=239 RepID=UPI002A80610F|nr:lipocalin family protein [Flavobacterium sp.]
MKTIILVSLFFLQFQTSDLVGKWSFSKFEPSKNLDNESKAIASNAFSKFSFEFRNDATYDMNKSRKKESGTWKTEAGFIVTTNSDGFTDKIKFIQKHKDTLRLEIEAGDFIVFNRAQ